jgi:hypothetical protein
MGCGTGALITPNQTLTLMEVDPLVGSTAGGVLQTAQRIGLAVGQGVIGAVFFAAIEGHGPHAYGHAVAVAVVAALGFVAGAVLTGSIDLAHERRRHRPGGARRP